tara:strand:- start:189 stop:935 length:747 start_codon:yes stop_codon:yes gene_type:complete
MTDLVPHRPVVPEATKEMHQGLSGRLIVVEGADGSGRTTQIELLTEWLEHCGHAVETMGLRRSYLVARNLDEVMGRNVVTRTTLSLLYATDFFDQLENRILPALRSGFVVLADRYFYSLIVRAVVRGIPSDYLEEIYRIARKPDLAFRLDVSPRVAFDRTFADKGEISFWESGRDLHLKDDLFASFLEYQGMLRTQFDQLADRNDFLIIDGEASVSKVNENLRLHIGKLLGIEDLSFQPASSFGSSWD